MPAPARESTRGAQAVARRPPTTRRRPGARAPSARRRRRPNSRRTSRCRSGSTRRDPVAPLDDATAPSSSSSPQSEIDDLLQRGRAGRRRRGAAAAGRCRTTRTSVKVGLVTRSVDAERGAEALGELVLPRAEVADQQDRRRRAAPARRARAAERAGVVRRICRRARIIRRPASACLARTKSARISASASRAAPQHGGGMEGGDEHARAPRGRPCPAAW